MKSKKIVTLVLVYSLWSIVYGLSGCGPTYPKEQFKESVIKVCKNEYSLDVKTETVGRTIAIYVPLADLIDFTFSISKEASEKINDVILSVSRVALSTDAGFDFYCIIAHDVRIPEIQIVIIKSVDDVKRFLLNDISRGEYSKRMLVDIRMNPQSQKERAIKEVFSKMSLDMKWQEQVMNDFFRSEPAALSDIGYWGNHFYIKDVSLAEFLVEQIASRIKIRFREEKKLSDLFYIKSSRGAYIKRIPKRFFKIEITAEERGLEGLGSLESSKRIFAAALKEASGVLHGYRFEDFDYVEVIREGPGESIIVSREGLEKFRTKKIKLEDVLRGGR